MKVNNVNTSELYKAYNANAPDSALPLTGTSRRPQGSTSSVQDRVNISSKVQQMKDIDKAVNATPDVRPDKVAEVEQRIKNGSYQADFTRIADKLLNPDLSARI